MPTPFKWIADFVVGSNGSGANDRNPSVLSLPNGQFQVLVANGFATDTDPLALVFNGGGLYLLGLPSTSFEGGSTVNGDQLSGATLNDGRRVYAWTEAPAAGGGDGRDVYLEIRFANSSTGSVDVDRILIAGGAGDQLEPVVAANLSTFGGFAVAYNDQSVADGRISVKFYSVAGTLLNTAVTANTTVGVSNYASGDYRHIAITALSNGNYVVGWYDASPEESRFQIFSSSGATIGAEVTLAGAGSEYQPSVVALADGRFVITYYGIGNAIAGQIFNADGTLAVSAFTVGTDADQGTTQNVSTAALADGRFVTVWQTNTGDIRGQVMFANGTADGASFIANTSTTGDQTDPHVSALPDGRFVVTWTDTDPAIDVIMATIFDPRETNINQSGSSFGDDAYGTSFNDAYYAGSGNDTVRGQGGSDYILGEAGNDSLLGGDATDLLYGGAGLDNLQGESGDDFVYGGVGDDTVSGAGGNDVLYGEGGADFIAGDDGNDTVLGGDGNDSMYGYANEDAMDGGAGNDTIYAGLGNDFARGSDGADTIIGEDGNDTLYGDAGADSLDGGIGADTFYGGADNDFAQGGAGGDVLIGESGQDDLRGGDDDDSIVGGADGDTLRGEAGNDFVQGGDGDDFIDGGANVDDVRGGNGNDTIIGGSGGDTMYGNAGNDVFRFAVGSGSDAIVGWEDGLDRIDITTYAGATFGNTVIAQVGGDTRVTFVSGDSVLLIGVTAATVTIADFIV